MRSTRWRELHNELTSNPHMLRTLRRWKTTPAKHTDSLVAWYAFTDLQSIHRSDYRSEDDVEIREALDNARVATKRLGDLLFKRRRR